MTEVDRLNETSMSIEHLSNVRCCQVAESSVKNEKAQWKDKLMEKIFHMKIFILNMKSPIGCFGINFFEMAELFPKVAELFGATGRKPMY